MHILIATAIAAPEPDQGVLTCPVCGTWKVTLTHLDCRALGSTHGEVQVGRDGVRIDPSIAHPEGGPTVGLRCICERGHESVIRFRQVRGTTVVERNILPFWDEDRAQPGREVR